MDKERYQILNDYYRKNKNLCLALNNWIQLKRKDFKLIDALDCIFKYADDKVTIVTDIIEHLTDKDKTFGRGHVYVEDPNNGTKIDIKDNNGELELVNYRSSKPLTPAGQHSFPNSKIFRKSDNQTKEKYKNTEERFYNIGAAVRELYPNESKDTIEKIIAALHSFSVKDKRSIDNVIRRFKKGKLKYDKKTNTIVAESKTVKISKSTLKLIKEELEMSEYKFCSNIKKFLSELLSDPVNAKPSMFLEKNGFDRNTLIRDLIKYGILEKKQKISDKDENGQAKTSVMKVKYAVPKEMFKHKLKKYYIMKFENGCNTDENCINEDGEGGLSGATSCASSGQFIQPLTTKPLSRKINNVTMESRLYHIIRENIKRVLAEETQKFQRGSQKYRWLDDSWKSGDDANPDPDYAVINADNGEVVGYGYEDELQHCKMLANDFRKLSRLGNFIVVDKNNKIVHQTDENSAWEMCLIKSF